MLSLVCPMAHGFESLSQHLRDCAGMSLSLPGWANFRGADLCVATVGRLYDFVGAGIISVADVNCFVLDEADRMLDLGWKEQIEDIVARKGPRVVANVLVVG